VENDKPEKIPDKFGFLHFMGEKVDEIYKQVLNIKY
jgi:hypothetical protein